MAPFAGLGEIDCKRVQLSEMLESGFRYATNEKTKRQDILDKEKDSTQTKTENTEKEGEVGVGSILSSGSLPKLRKRDVLLEARARPFWPTDRWRRWPRSRYDGG